MCKAVEFRSKTFQISLFSSEDAIASSFKVETPVVNIVPFCGYISLYQKKLYPRKIKYINAVYFFVELEFVYHICLISTIQLLLSKKLSVFEGPELYSTKR